MAMEPASASASPRVSMDGEERGTFRAVGGVALGALQATGSGLWVAGSYIGSAVAARRGSNVENFDATGHTLGALGSAEVLKIANVLNGVLAESEGAVNLPEVPRMAVVGTQSSGKSSLLNGIMAADILPLGTEMVTRTPLNLQLIHEPDGSQMRAEFGVYQEGGWNIQQSVGLSCPNPSADEINSIRVEIERQTEQYAGSMKGISTKPIFLKIFSPNVPDLSLVDLPGLTMTALTEQGQPKDIKKQVREMVSSYIEQERTIILAVMPARTDLEADPALELVKEFDPKGARTVGVLTKVDLMNQGTDICKYLTGNVPSDLRMQLGYFAVRNRSNMEITGPSAVTIQEGFIKERDFFLGHARYSTLPNKERLGIPALASYLSKILVQHMKDHLPQILSEISALTITTEERLRQMGQAVPKDESSRGCMVQTFVAEFCRDFVGALVEKRADVKTGRRIKDSFLELQQQLQALAPFSTEEYPDTHIMDAVRDCEGNHLSFPIPPIEVIEQLLQNPERRPIRLLLAPCQTCLQAVHEELRSLTEQLLQKPGITRFPRLRARILEEMFDNVLGVHYREARGKIEELVLMEEGYINTDDPTFLLELQNAVKKLAQKLDAALIRSILTSYYSTVQRSIVNSAPKAIMWFLVKRAQDNVHTTLLENIARMPTSDLLNEPPEVFARRETDQAQVDKLRTAKQVLERTLNPKA